MTLGQRIRAIRKEKHMTLRQLEHKLSVIFGKKALRYNTLYRIEKGLRDARTNSLSQICLGLGISRKELQTAAGEKSDLPVKLIRPQDNLAQYVYSEKAIAQVLSAAQKPFSVLRLMLAPGGKTKVEQEPPGTEKFVYVLKGRVTVGVERERYAVCKDQVLSLPGSLPHYFENVTAHKALCLVVKNS